MACTTILGIPVYVDGHLPLTSYTAALELICMHFKPRPPQEVGRASGVSQTRRLLFLLKPLPHPPSPGSLRRHLSWDLGFGAGAGNSTCQRFPSVSPRLCLGALQQGFPDLRAGSRMESLPVPTLGEGQRWKEPELGPVHTVTHRGDWGQPQPAFVLLSSFQYLFSEGPCCARC